MAQALEGIRIIDLTRLAPGPYCTMLLADLGADVVWVEEFGPVTGRRAEQGKGVGASTKDIGFIALHSTYNALARNKRSIGLNLKTAEAKQVFYRMAQGADVVVEEFRPGVAKRLGIDYDTLKEINPRIIYCAITGYGQSGPYQDLPGHDVNYISMAGAISLMGNKGEPPMIPSNIIADYGGGVHAAFAILAAVVAREKTGRGQFVDSAMADGVISLLAHMLSWSYGTGKVPGQGEHASTGFYPFYNVFETKDGKFISLGCMEPWFYANLCRALGREDFIPYQFDIPDEKRQEIFSAFKKAFLTKTRDEWFELLAKNDVCVGKVYTLDELASDPQIQYRQMIVEITDPTVGKIKQPGIATKLSDTPGQIRRPVPRRGEHTVEVLQGLGYSAAEIESLREAGAIPG